MRYVTPRTIREFRLPDWASRKHEIHSRAALRIRSLFVASVFFIVAGYVVSSPSRAPQWRTPQAGWLYVLDHGDALGGPARVLLVDPNKGRVMGSLDVGDAPEMALSPDGKRLYVAGVLDQGDFLTVIDTATGSALQSVPLRDRWQYTGMPEAPTMTVSTDGRWLYVLKLHIIPKARDEYTIGTFDTLGSVFQAAELPVPDCVAGSLLPSSGGEGVQVFCSGTNDVRFLFSGNRDHRVLPLPAISSETGPWAKIKIGVRAPNGNTLAVMGDGRILEIDPESTKVVRVLNDRLNGSWVPSREVPRSPDAKILYIGIGRLSERSTGMADRILAIDTKTGRQLGSIKTSHPFWSLTISGDGRHLYAVGSEYKDLLILDTARYEEIRDVSGIGLNPARAVVVP